MRSRQRLVQERRGLSGIPDRSDEVTDAIDRALMAGIRLQQPAEGRARHDLVCQVCLAALSVPMRPLSPELAAWRLDVFTVRHLRHDVHAAGEPPAGCASPRSFKSE
jgi:hypothetical protein